MEPVEVGRPCSAQQPGRARPPGRCPRDDYPIRGCYTDPSGGSFSNPSGWGGLFVMLVTEQRRRLAEGRDPVRPNGHPGYVAAVDVELSTTDYRLDLPARHPHVDPVQRGDDVVMTTPVVIGKPETRTPTGCFYITDLVHQEDPAGAYGPLAGAADQRLQ